MTLLVLLVTCSILNDAVEEIVYSSTDHIVNNLVSKKGVFVMIILLIERRFLDYHHRLIIMQYIAVLYIQAIMKHSS